MNTRLKGRRLCGAVTFAVTSKGGMGACHCEMCHRMSGGVFLTVERKDDAAVQRPVRTYDSSSCAVRQFCGGD